MNLMTHAEQELKWAGYSMESEDSMDREIYRQTMIMVQAFSKCGHSGSSAYFHADMVNSLLKYEPLTPITDNPDEWMEVSDMMGPNSPATWQCRRAGKFFSEDGGKTYYSVDEFRYGWRKKLFGRRGKTYTSVSYKENK